MRLANNRLTPNLDAPPQELNSTELVSLAGTAVGLEPISSVLETDILTNWTITAYYFSLAIQDHCLQLGHLVFL